MVFTWSVYPGLSEGGPVYKGSLSKNGRRQKEERASKDQRGRRHCAVP